MIPGFQEIFKPLLEVINDGEDHSNKDVLAELTNQFKLTAEEQAALLPSGNQEIFENRLGWAITYLKKALVLHSPRRATIAITDRGRALLAEDPPDLSVRFLKKYPEFKEWQERRPSGEDENEADEVDEVPASEESDQLLVDRYRKYGRGNESAARLLFEKLFPDELDRMSAEDFLSQCVRCAHLNNPNNWEITKGNKAIRLNVGFARVLFIEKSRITVYLLKSAVTNPILTKHAAVFNFGIHFKSLDVETIECEFPPDKAAEIFPDLVPGALAFVKINSPTSKSSVWADSHSPGVLDYLRIQGYKEIPSPMYEQEYISRAKPRPAPDAVVPVIHPVTQASGIEVNPVPPPLSPEYSEVDFTRETGFQPSRLETWLNALERKNQMVFFGPPGTGKSYVAHRLSRRLVSGTHGFVETIQFHPGYSYEEFIEGIRPVLDGIGGMKFELKRGRFLEFCDEARKTTDPCVLIIDEMNRANLSKVFGELMLLLEYRDMEMSLAGGRKFSIPKNVRIIGTMNTADRSIALVDFALRRRFAFLELSPEYDVLLGYQNGQGFDATALVRVIREINARINDKNFHLGLSFFMVEKLAEHVQGIWTMEIEPYLEEYFFGQPEAADQFRWNRVQARITA